MLRSCAWCGKFIGFKAPYLNLRTTHGICEFCAEALQREISQSQLIRTQERSEPTWTR